MILVCDVCGKPASDTISIRVGGRNLTKDVCETHLAELVAGARPARRGRRRGGPGAKSAPARARETAAKAKGGGGRGRPRAQAAQGKGRAVAPSRTGPLEGGPRPAG